MLAIKRILVVDDDPQLRLLLVDTLQTIGYDAIGVSDGIEAMEEVKKDPFDVVISDIAMPRMDGIALANEVRRRHPETVILLITGVATEDTERKARQENLCDGYLAKPFRIDRIEAMIESLAGHSGTPEPAEGRRILVVDDDPLFLDALVETVSQLGYQAEGAQDSYSALMSLAREPASVVVADVSMPEMNGFDLLKTLKRQYPQVSVVIMTGHNLSEPAAAMIRDHADAYLTKPFRQEAIRDVLSQFEK